MSLPRCHPTYTFKMSSLFLYLVSIQTARHSCRLPICYMSLRLRASQWAHPCDSSWYGKSYSRAEAAPSSFVSTWKEEDALLAAYFIHVAVFLSIILHSSNLLLLVQPSFLYDPISSLIQSRRLIPPQSFTADARKSCAEPTFRLTLATTMSV
jgi:hypothetical protein